MSERDSVHKEIEKLQEEVGETKKKMNGMESKSRNHDEEVKLSRPWETNQLSVCIHFQLFSSLFLFIHSVVGCCAKSRC